MTARKTPPPAAAAAPDNEPDSAPNNDENVGDHAHSITDNVTVDGVLIRCAYTELRPIEQVIPNPDNPNTHPEAQVERLAAAITAHGWRVPITVSALTGHIVRGEGRYHAAQRLGMQRVPIDLQPYDTATQELADLIADNRLSELAAMDDDRLVLLLQQLDENEELYLAAYTSDELALLQLATGTTPGGVEDEDSIPPPPVEGGEAASVPGEVYQLGPHRLLCGDATDTAAYAPLMGGEAARVLFTDPPWNVAIGGDNNPRHRQRTGLANDDLPAAEFVDFLDRFIVAAGAWVTGDVYVVLGASEWPTLDRVLRANGYHWSATVIWVKQQFVLGRSKYHRRYEPLWYGWSANGASSFNGARDLDDVWEIPRPFRSEEHPTMKPVELMVRAITNSSIPGDIVLDPFGGSGSTLIAAAQTGRRCFTIELDPGYCDVIRRRWGNFARENGLEPGEGALL